MHHIAWRASDDADHTLEKPCSGERLSAYSDLDRQYFNAIYFREEGGILFEIATDPPGFHGMKRLSGLVSN